MNESAQFGIVRPSYGAIRRVLLPIYAPDQLVFFAVSRQDDRRPGPRAGPKVREDRPSSIAQSTSRTRLISDDPRWEARVSYEYEKDAAGDAWDLLELFVYRQPRMTAAVRGEVVNLRFYIPDPWEPIFLCFDPRDNTPLKQHP